MALHEKKLLITSGPTRAPLDAVRYITNKATGKLGAMIAERALQRGADVTYVYGRPGELPVARGGRDHLRLIPVETADDLVAAFREELPKRYGAVVHPMAVLDFQPDSARDYKTSSDTEEWVIRLVPTTKAIKLVKDLAPDTFLVGFKLEIGKEPRELQSIAFEFLKRNRCDLVIANDLKEIEAGRHTGYFVTPDGKVHKTAIGKEAIARTLIDYLDEVL
jgi:phosphopantothenoylcysteine synthetase/decarboxylase